MFQHFEAHKVAFYRKMNIIIIFQFQLGPRILKGKEAIKISDIMIPGVVFLYYSQWEPADLVVLAVGFFFFS